MKRYGFLQSANSIRVAVSRIVGISCIVFLQFGFVFGQCEKDDFSDKCAVFLDNYNYVRSYEATEIEGSTNYPHSNAYIFSKGMAYIITRCDQGNDQNTMIVNLYNPSRKLVASTYDKKTDKHYSKIIFHCSATGIFFIQPLVSIKEGGCGISMLGFKNKST